MVIGLPYVWLLIFFLIPFLIVVGMSFATRTSTAPPFGFGGENPLINLTGYARLFTDTLYIRAFVTSLTNAAGAMILCLLIGYPMALGLTRVDRGWRNILLMLVILPFWTSFLLRVYAWMGLMGSNSWFNKLLTGAWNWVVPQAWDVANVPLMHSNFAVVLVMVYTYLPFMILPLYANLVKMDFRLLEAAYDLGTSPFKAFWLVTVPLSKAGKLRVLGVSTKQRSKVAPDVPSMAEGGITNFDATAWFALFAPTGTPRDIINRLNREVAEAVKDPAVADKLLALGAEPVSSTPEQLDAFYRSEVARWAQVVRQARVTID